MYANTSDKQISTSTLYLRRMFTHDLHEMSSFTSRLNLQSAVTDENTRQREITHVSRPMVRNLLARRVEANVLAQRAWNAEANEKPSGYRENANCCTRSGRPGRYVLFC